jgi:transposase
MGTRMHVEFTLTAIGLDPKEITSRIGIRPTKTWRKGDQIQKSLLKFKHDGWSISTKENDGDIGLHIKQLMDQLKPHKTKLKKIIKDLNLDAELSCVVFTEEDDRPAIYFKRNVIEFLAELGADIDIDLY